MESNKPKEIKDDKGVNKPKVEELKKEAPKVETVEKEKEKEKEKEPKRLIESPDEFRKRVVEIAKSFVGQKEIAGNKAFNDKKFEALMKKVGWSEGQAWCAYFTELVYKLAIEPDVEKWDNNPTIKYLNKTFSAGAVKTFDNFAGTAEFTFSRTPRPGDLICFRKYHGGNPSWEGHIGIVEDVNSFIKTIEGNTNSQGGREGIEVGNMRRYISFDKPKTGIVKLVLLGFITVKDSLI